MDLKTEQFSKNNSSEEQFEKILPVKKIGPIVAGIVSAIIACVLLYGILTNPRFEWDQVGIYLISNNVLSGIFWTLWLTLLSMVIAIVLVFLEHVEHLT